MYAIKCPFLKFRPIIHVLRCKLYFQLNSVGEDMVHTISMRGSFIEDTVVELERSHPDTIARMLLVAHTVLPVNGDGIGISKASGKVRPTATLHRPCWMR